MAGIGSLVLLGAMRVGYAARGVVYLTVGILALAASAGGGPAPGLVGAVHRLGQMPWHRPILVALALGLLLYAVWRGLDAIADLAGHGRGLGLVERFGLSIIAVLHVVFAFHVLRLVIGGASAPGDGGEVANLVAGLIGNPAGRIFVVLAGIGTISFGVHSAWQGAGGGYRAHMRPLRLLDAAGPLLAFGLIARGAVFAVMGGFIAWAGWNLEPTAAGGFGDALEYIRGLPHGRALLAVVGSGLIAFAIFCFVEAAFRVLPERPSGH